jgi:ubiquinone/menaquinone biosynthesis C-methylase UbiE
MADQEQWQLDGSAPELYQRHLVPAITAMWAADLVDRAALAPGQRVLDVACGTGVVARRAAERVGAAGSVDAIDLNAGMLAVARSLPGAVRWHHGSALFLPFARATFDVVLCQLGLQFFPDRPLALREMRRVIAPRGRLALNVFGPIEHNPATHALADALDRHFGPDASIAKRIEHVLADATQLRGLVERAGFAEVAIEVATKAVRFPSAADYVRVQLAATPLAGVIAEACAATADRDRGAARVDDVVGVPVDDAVGAPVDDAVGAPVDDAVDAPVDDRVAALVDDVAAALAPSVGADGLTFPQEVQVVLARA